MGGNTYDNIPYQSCLSRAKTVIIRVSHMTVISVLFNVESSEFYLLTYRGLGELLFARI